MNPHLSSSADPHPQIVLLLPWYINQSLETSDLHRVEKHLRSCLLCRREVLELRKLAAAVQLASDLDVAAEASFADFRAKLQTAVPLRQQPTSSSDVQPVGRQRKPIKAAPGLFGNRRRRFWRFTGNAGKHLAIAASLLLATLPLVMHFQHSPNSTDYYTLSATKPESISDVQLWVVFSKTLPDSDIDSVLSQIQGIRVDGPNSVGAYTVKLAPGDQVTNLAYALALLRSRQDVILAEPVLQP